MPARRAGTRRLAESYRRKPALEAVCDALAAARAACTIHDDAALIAAAEAALARLFAPSLRRVFNLTGTVLHTNLGRALLLCGRLAELRG